MKKLIIVGIGEQAHLAYEYFTHDSDYEICGFSVDQQFLPQDKKFLDKPVVPFENVESFFPPSEFNLFVAIPASQLNQLRKRFYLAGKEKGYKFASYVSSNAFKWHNVKIGENTFIFEDNTLQPFVEIGNNVILWSGNHIGHRTVIQDHCFITSHVVISGFCNIGEASFLGVNSTVNDKVHIAPNTVIGAASLVHKSITEPDGLYVGSPMKKVEGKKSSDIKF